MLLIIVCQLFSLSIGQHSKTSCIFNQTQKKNVNDTLWSTTKKKDRINSSVFCIHFSSPLKQLHATHQPTNLLLATVPLGLSYSCWVYTEPNITWPKQQLPLVLLTKLKTKHKPAELYQNSHKSLSQVLTNTNSIEQIQIFLGR